MEERGAHLDAPPKRRLWPFLMFSFGLPKDEACPPPLHAGESGTLVKGQTKGIVKKVKAVEDYYGPSRLIEVVEEQTQDTLLNMVSLLQGGLNEEIKQANIRRKADAEVTKVAISNVEDEVNIRFDGNDIILNHYTRGKCLWSLI